MRSSSLPPRWRPVGPSTNTRSPAATGERSSARRTSGIWPITETSRVGGIEIFTPPRWASFFIESLPLISGTPNASQAARRPSQQRTSWASLCSPSGVLSLCAGSGQQKLSSAARRSTRAPAHSARRTASSTQARAIASVSRSP